MSQTSPFTLAAKTLRANPSLIDLAISKDVTPGSNCLIAPSGKVTLIIDKNCIF